MSRAFVKESDGEDEDLPERALSPHPNFVTPRGLELLESRVRELEAARSAARLAGDKTSLARIARDLRYFQARRDSARPVAAAQEPDAVRFGVKVWLRDGGGGERALRIVGEDEADPRAGLVSYVSPVARALIGCAAGDTVSLADGAAEIIRLEP